MVIRQEKLLLNFNKLRNKN